VFAMAMDDIPEGYDIPESRFQFGRQPEDYNLARTILSAAGELVILQDVFGYRRPYGATSAPAPRSSGPVLTP
jgi:hypothetical protein